MNASYKLSAPLFNAVLSAQAVDDVRDYLNGFFVCANRYELVATNGHMICKALFEAMGDAGPIVTDAVKGPYEQARFECVGWIFRGVSKPLRKTVQEVIIHPTAEPEKRLELIGDRYTGPRFMKLETIDGTYPDYLRVMKHPDRSASVSVPFAYNAEYLYRPLKWAHMGPELCEAKITPNEGGGPALVEFRRLACLEMYLMPIKVFRSL